MAEDISKIFSRVKRDPSASDSENDMPAAADSARRVGWPRERFGARVFVFAALVTAVIGASGAAAYYYREYAALKKNPQKIAQEEIQRVMATVARHLVLPKGEVPTVATVTDPEKLKDQPFFANVKIGDKILIYTNAKKAILYDPSLDRIMEVAPLNIGNQQQ